MQPTRPLWRHRAYLRIEFPFKELPLTKESVTHKQRLGPRWRWRPCFHSSLESGQMEIWSFTFSKPHPQGAAVRTFTTQATWMGKEKSRLISLFQYLSWAVWSSKSRTTSQGSELEATAEVIQWSTPHFPDEEIETQWEPRSLCWSWDKPHLYKTSNNAFCLGRSKVRKSCSWQQDMARLILTPNNYCYSCKIIPLPREGFNKSWPNE